jgi:hypothetical protein
MYVATISVHPPPAVTPAAKEQFRCILRQQALRHPIEHMHIRDGPEHLQVTLFVRTPTQQDACLLGYHLCAQTVRRLPGWHLDT